MIPAERRILVLMAHTGGGHRSVSLALQGAVEELAGRSVAVDLADAFDLGEPALLDRVTRLYGPVIRHAPWLYGWAYNLANEPQIYRAIVEQARRALVRRYQRLIEEGRPNAIVAVHPLCIWFVLRALRNLGADIPLVATVTELVNVHRSWVDPEITHWTVATEEARDAVLAHGALPERITCTGLPISGSFGAATLPPERIRLRLGLDPDRLTLLMIGGAEGTGDLDKLVTAVAESGIDAQLIVVCGRNRRLRVQLRQATLPMPARLLGFVDNMPELMHGADVVLTKGGPTSIVEALASARPIVVIQTLPGQEAGNAAFVEAHGVGIDGRTPAQAVAAVRRLAADRALRLAMGQRARDLARPEAAREAARVILKFAEEPCAVW